MLNNKHTRSQCKTVLKFMREHKRGISQKQASKKGINCLAERIRDLRKKGYIIENDWYTYKNEEGHNVRYTSYVLVGEPE